MTDDPFDVDRLDGHTIEELSDYLDAGRVPVDPSIEESAGCQIALSALERLRAASAEVIEEAESDPARDEGWIRAVLSSIVMDAHAGRDIPVPHPDPRLHLAVTEGAVRELVRTVGDAVPGVVVGRVRLDGDVTEVGAPVTVEASVAVRYGREIPAVADEVRSAVRAALETHTGMTIVGVTVSVTDVWDLPEGMR